MARGASRRSGRRWLLAAALLLVGGGIALGLGGGPAGEPDHPHGEGSAGAGRPPAPAISRPVRGAEGTVPSTAGVPQRSLPVTTTVLSLVDRSRTVSEDGVVLADQRNLTTTVFEPATSARAPLVVFAPGYGVGPATYQRFCATLASAGYVVAAPSFPLEDPAQGFPLDRADLPNEAQDVAFVISSLLSGPLAGRLDPQRVAVVGHSDGADVALMVGYEAGTIDPRPAAVVALAPDPLSGPLAGTTKPLLLVQGSADSVVPYSASQEVFGSLGEAGVPVWYLTLLGADHLPPLIGGTPWTPLLDQAVADFLDATVAGRGPGRGALAAQLSGSSLDQLRTSATAGS